MIKAVTVEMNESDFEHLYDTSMNWAGTDWEVQDGRFYPLPDYEKFERAYWFSSYGNLLLARAYLTAMGFDSATHFDEADGDACYVLLTDAGGKL